MKVLITGGAGFIGSHLAEAYLNRGDDVYIIDDLSTGSMDNLQHLTSDNQFQDRLFTHHTVYHIIIGKNINVIFFFSMN